MHGVAFAAGHACLHRLAQPCGIPAFAAEGQLLHTAQSPQQEHRPPGKQLRRGKGIRHRQLQHQIRPGCYGDLGTGQLAQHSRIPTLHKVAAHDRNDVGGAVFAGLCNVIGMAVVKGIVLANNSGNFHPDASFAAGQSRRDPIRSVFRKSPVQHLRGALVMLHEEALPHRSFLCNMTK